MPPPDKKPPQPQPPVKAKAGEFGSAFDNGPRSPRTTSEISLAKPAPLPAKPKGLPPKKPGYGKKQPLKAGPPPIMTSFQKDQLGSGFVDSSKHQQRQTVIGSNPALFNDDDEDDTQSTASVATFDGLKAPEELTGRDLWRALKAPVQSKPGRRHKGLYEQVLKQFAVASNPRYAPDAIDKNRSHIFAWDVSLAMNCEIPHFVGAKEHNLSQTTDWLRHEGPMRGWVRVNEANIYTVVDLGQLVVAVPKDPRRNGMAIVPPQARGFVPTVVSAGLKRGWGIGLRDALGVSACEYFTHP